jgi:hypothetical protein
MGAILNVLIVRKQLMIIYLVHNFPQVSHDKKVLIFEGRSDKFLKKGIVIILLNIEPLLFY